MNGKNQTAGNKLTRSFLYSALFVYFIIVSLIWPPVLLTVIFSKAPASGPRLVCKDRIPIPVVLNTCVLLQENDSGLSSYTDKKENKIFLIYKEIQNGVVAKSYMTNGLLIQFMGKYLRISSYSRKPFLLYDCATDPLWISLYMRTIWFLQCTSVLPIFCKTFRSIQKKNSAAEAKNFVSSNIPILK